MRLSRRQQLLQLARAGLSKLIDLLLRLEEEVEAIVRTVRAPMLINMFHGGKTPLVPVKRLQELGYRVVIIPSDLQRAAIRAMQEVLAAIARDGHSANLADRMASFLEREAIVGTKALLECGEQYAEGSQRDR